LTEWLLRSSKGPGPRELAGAAILLLAIGAAAYGLYVTRGGFYSDDWANAANYRFADPPRYWSSVDQLEGVLGGRPLLAVLLPVPHAVFGTDTSLQLAFALVLGILTSCCFYALLRTLSMAPLHAAAIAALALLFPWSDSIRLWATASVNSVAVCLFLLGLTVALRGLEHRGRRGIAMHAAADLLYLLSILTYEVAAAAAMLAGFLYIGRASLMTAVRRWSADVIVVLGAITYSLTTTVSTRHVGTLGERINDAGEFGREALLLLASSLVPLGSQARPLQALILVLAATVVGLAALRVRGGSDAALRRWLWWTAVAAVAIAAAYFMFLGSHLHPRDPGIDTRINVFAGLAYCLLVYAVVATACHLLLGPGSRAAALTVVSVAAIGFGYGIQLRDDQRDWELASSRQQELLRVAADQPKARWKTLVTFGAPAQAAPEVPIFNKSWDLRGALRLEFDDAGLRGFPIFEGIKVRCGSDSLIVDGGGDYGRHRAGYGPVLFLDVPTSRRKRIDGAEACLTATHRFAPGPVEVSGR
jgi:hypothetical protein